MFNWSIITRTVGAFWYIKMVCGDAYVLSDGITWMPGSYASSSDTARVTPSIYIPIVSYLCGTATLHALETRPVFWIARNRWSTPVIVVITTMPACLATMKEVSFKSCFFIKKIFLDIKNPLLILRNILYF